MKKLVWLLCCLTLVLSLVACGNTPAPQPNAPQQSTEQKQPASTPKTEESLPTQGAPTQELPTTEATTEEDLPTEEALPSGPRFESDDLEVYASQFQNDLKKIYKATNSQLYIETTDGGFYHGLDEERSNNLVADQAIASWSFAEFTGLVTVDANGYYTIDGGLAHGINGDILYAYASGKLYVYSVDAEGYVYLNSFESTGKKVDDNVKLSFQEKKQDGYSFEPLGTYDKVEEIRVLPAKGNYISSPTVLLKVNGHTYVQTIFLTIVQNKVSLITNSALTEDEATHMLDYYSYQTVYSKDGVNDKLFYLQDNDEYVLNLPDGHTLDQMTYFCRGVEDLMVFDNGDVYLWKGQASILGETPVKHEGLSKVGTEMKEIFCCSNTYRVLMSDGVIYTIDD